MHRTSRARKRWTDLLSLGAALQQVGRLVVLQVADAGIGPSVQQQPQDLLLVGAGVEAGRHVQSRVAVSLQEGGKKHRPECIRMAKRFKKEIENPAESLTFMFTKSLMLGRGILSR